MKRLFAGLLALTLSLSGLASGVYAEESSATASVGKADLSVMLRLAYPENREALAGKTLKVKLLNGNKTVILSETLTGEGADSNTVRVVARNSDGTPITTESEVGSFKVDFLSLPCGQDYYVSLEGKGYKTFMSQPVRLDDYSRAMQVSTDDGTFTIGDVNSDGRVDRLDLNAVSQTLGTADTGADLNGDGGIDIVDIALVNHNIGAAGDRETMYETTAVASNVAELGALPADIKITGDLLNAESGPTTVEVSNGKDLSVPILFPNSQELSRVEISSPLAEGAVREGTITVLTNQGEEIIPFSYDVPDGAHALTATGNSSTIVIDLGRRVVVKKITVTVTKVEGQADGSKPTFAVIDEIKFIRDIVPDSPKSDSAVPKNLAAEAADGKIKLTWKPVSNVTGYRVSYGTASGVYTMELNTEVPSADITGLKNLTPYYFVVCSVNGAWKSAQSSEITATPEPASVPMPPDNLKLREMNNALMASWGKTKNATSYSVYYKKSADKEYTQVASGLTTLNYGIGGLENGTEYSVYVTASNSIGESRPSLVSTAIPQKEALEPPVLPTDNRISSDHITDVVLTQPDNVDQSQYPNHDFDVNHVKDGDFTTHWTARTWSQSRELVFTFDQEQSMDYLIYVPRLDGAYRKSLDTYNIRVWEDQSEKPITLASGASVQNNPATTGFAILPFKRNDHIKKLAVQVNQWAGSPTNISLAEIAFYSYSDLSERIQGLFANKSLTALRQGVTAEEIGSLEEAANNTNGYYVDREVLLDELTVARGLLENDRSVLGRVLDGVQSRNTAGDIKTINTFQPMGVVANAKSKVVIYADIPEGETVSVVPTQYYAEASSWAGSEMKLSAGRNILTIPQLTTINTEKGGALYLKYAGSHPEQIKLQIRGAATKIPVLELSDWDSLSESKRKEIISDYITELQDFYSSVLNGKMGGKEKTFIRNSTEISMPNVLLSLPAMPVYNTLNSKGNEKAAAQLYNNVLAWNDVIKVIYCTHGIDDPSQEHSRQNIRYARMFADAFMYASGAHIGIGYGSASGLVQGEPVNVTGEGQPNKLFGWGIAHEIGHVMDTLGKAEITNNIYSMFVQTYDGGQNALTSRLEGGKYDAVFQKTALGAKGQANDVFVSLAMYWQLHLAYDGASDNFYYKVNQSYRNGQVSGFSGDEKFAVAASLAAGRDLSEFFTHWGVSLSGSAKAAMPSEKEPRAIWYLSDASRRASDHGKPSAPSVSATLSGRTATITLDGPSGIQGYEIFRNDVPIAFTNKTSFTDSIGSANNIEITYSARAVSIAGYLSDFGQADPLRLNADNILDKALWSAQTQEDGTILVTFESNAPDIAGIHIKQGWHAATEDNSLEEQPTQEEEKSDSQSKPDEPKENSDSQSKPDEPEDTASSKPSPSSSTPEDEGEQDVDKEEDPSAGSETSSEQEQIPVESESAESSSSALPLDTDESARTRVLAATTDGEDDPEATKENPDELGEGPDETKENPDEIRDNLDETKQDDESGVHSDTEKSDQDLNGDDEEQKADVPAADVQEPDAPSNDAMTVAAVDPKILTVQVSTDQERYQTVLEVTPAAGVEESHLFTREGSGDGIGIYDAKTAILRLPAGMTTEDIEFMAYAGDGIEFIDGGIGKLAQDFNAGDRKVSRGTVVVVGTYRGDPVYNTVHINGRYLTGSATDDENELTTVERPINGDIYLTAEEPDKNGMAEINGGIWIFVPNVQREQAIASKGDANACYTSVLPGEIQAELYRTDVPDSSDSKRTVSTTLWISSPTEDTMPEIDLRGGGQ